MSQSDATVLAWCRRNGGPEPRRPGPRPRRPEGLHPGPARAGLGPGPGRWRWCRSPGPSVRPMWRRTRPPPRSSARPTTCGGSATRFPPRPSSASGTATRATSTAVRGRGHVHPWAPRLHLHDDPDPIRSLGVDQPAPRPDDRIPVLQPQGARTARPRRSSLRIRSPGSIVAAGDPADDGRMEVASSRRARRPTWWLTGRVSRRCRPGLPGRLPRPRSLVPAAETPR